jgi:hypothetical protein
MVRSRWKMDHRCDAHIDKGAPMACRFTELAVDAREPEALARFWAEVLGWQVDEREGVHFLLPPNPAVPVIVFASVPEPKTIKNRVHIDVSPTDRTRDEEVDRILALGAAHADVGQGDVPWVVLQDPEGNEFCVLGSRVEGDLTKWPWPGMD